MRLCWLAASRIGVEPWFLLGKSSKEVFKDFPVKGLQYVFSIRMFPRATYRTVSKSMLPASLACAVVQSEEISTANSKQYLLNTNNNKIFVKKNPTRCKSVSKFYYSIFIWSPTCFGRHTAHHQEPKTALAASGYHTWKVVGRVAGGRPPATQWCVVYRLYNIIYNII